jgi:hypothetical protein
VRIGSNASKPLWISALGIDIPVIKKQKDCPVPNLLDLKKLFKHHLPLLRLRLMNKKIRRLLLFIVKSVAANNFDNTK